MDGGDVEAGARRERGDRDLTLGRREGLEQVERPIDRLDRSAGALGCWGIFRFAQSLLYHVKG